MCRFSWNGVDFCVMQCMSVGDSGGYIGYGVFVLLVQMVLVGSRLVRFIVLMSGWWMFFMLWFGKLLRKVFRVLMDLMCVVKFNWLMVFLILWVVVFRCVWFLFISMMMLVQQFMVMMLLLILVMVVLVLVIIESVF